MDIYLIRHAVALPTAPGAADESRALSPEGRREFTAIVKRLKRAKVKIDLVVHSPVLRAVETAQILVKGLDVAETLVTPSLAEAPSEALLGEITVDRSAYVGHQPWMGQLCAWLVAGSRDLGPQFRFEKGGVAHLEGEPRPGGMAIVVEG